MKTVKNLLAALMLLSGPVAFAMDGEDGSRTPTPAVNEQGDQTPATSRLERARDFANSLYKETCGRYIPGMYLKSQYAKADENANRVKAAFQNFAHNHATAVNRMKVAGALGTTAAVIGGGALLTYKLIKKYGKTVAKKAKALFSKEEKAQANAKPAPKKKANAKPQVATNWKGGRRAAPAHGGCANGRCGR